MKESAISFEDLIQMSKLQMRCYQTEIFPKCGIKQHATTSQPMRFFEESAISFDKGRVVSSIQNDCTTNYKQCLKYSKQFSDMIRRHQISEVNLNELCRSLHQPVGYCYESRIKLAQAIKYAIVNGGKVDFRHLIEHLPEDIHYTIGSKLLQGLTALIKNLTEYQICQLKFALQQNKIFDKPFDLNSLNALKNQLFQRKILLKRSQEESFRFNKNKLSIKAPGITKTKNQVKTKTNHKLKNSQQTQIRILSMQDAIRKRKKKINQNYNQEILPARKQAHGSDRNWLTGTYTDIKKLYQQVVMWNKELKTDDKKYIQGKLISHSYLISRKRFSGGLVGNILIDRMILGIACHLTKPKQNVQPYKFDNQMIQKLFSLCGNFADVQNCIFSNKNDIQISEQIYKSSLIPLNDCTKIEKALTQKVTRILKQQKKARWYQIETYEHKQSKQNVLNKLIHPINQQINQIRKDALQTIFNINFNQKGGLIKDAKRKKIIQDLADDANEKKQIRKIAYRIIYSFQEQNQKDHSFKLKLSLKNLQEEQQQLDIAISYLLSRSFFFNPSVQQQFHKENVIARILNVILYKKISDQNRKDLCDCILNYFESSKEYIPLEIMQSIEKFLTNEKIKCPQLICQLLRIVLLATNNSEQNSCVFPIASIVNSFKQFDQLDNGDRIGNIVILILERIVQQINQFNINLIAPKLKDYRIPCFEESDMKFQNPSQNQKQSSISAVTGLIIWKIIINKKYSQIIDEYTFKYLTEALNGEEKQTCIYSIKILYQLTDTAFYNRPLTNIVKGLIASDVWDLSAYAKLIFSKVITRYTLSENDFQVLAQIYEFDSLILGDKDYAEELRHNIMNILQFSAKHQVFPVKQIYTVLTQVLFVEENKQRLMITIQILRNQAKLGVNFQVQVIQMIENQLFHYEYSDQNLYKMIMQLLEIIILNSQQVSDRILKIYERRLYQSQIGQNYEMSYEIISFANRNKSIQPSLFSSLQKQRAARALSFLQSSESICVLEFLKQKSNKSEKLTTNAIQKLSYFLKNDTCLQILQNVIKNRQSVPKNLFSNIQTIINQEKNSTAIIKLILVAVNAELSIPQSLVQSLKKIYLESNQEDKNILSQILIALINKKAYFQKQLFIQLCSRQIIKQYDQTRGLKYSHMIYNVLNYQSRQEQICYFSDQFLSQVISKTHCQQTLIKAVKSYYFISQVILLSNQNACQLLEKMRAQSCSKQLRNQILSLLTLPQVSYSLSYQTKKNLFIMNLDSKQDEYFVEILGDQKYVELRLGQKQFARIEDILIKQKLLVIPVLKIMQKIQNIQQMPKSLINTLCELYKYSKQKQIVGKAELILYQLLNKGIEIQKQVYYRILQKHDTNEQIKLSLMVNQKLKFPQEVYQLINYNTVLEIQQNSKNVENCLDKLIISQANGFIIPQFLLLFIFTLNSLIIGTKLYPQIIDKMAMILCKGIKNNYKLFKQRDKQSICMNGRVVKRSVVFTIEQSLKSKITKNTEPILDITNLYLQIVKQGYQQNYSQILQTVFEVMYKQPFHFLDINLGQILLIFCQRYRFQQLWIQILSQRLYGENGIVKHYCLKILRKLHQMSVSQYLLLQFYNWCEKAQNQIKKILKINMKIDLDLMQKLVAVEHINFKLFDNVSTSTLYTQLSLSNLMNIYCLDYNQVIELHSLCEKINRNINNRKIKQKFMVFLNISNLPYKELLEIIKCIQIYDTQMLFQYLKQNDERFENICKDTCGLLVSRKVNDRTKIEQIIKVVEDNKQKIPYSVCFSIIAKVSNFSNVKQFSNFALFLAENSVKQQDIQVLNFIEEPSISVLLKRIQIQLLGKYFKNRQLDKVILAYIFDELLDQKWKFEDIKFILSKAALSKKNIESSAKTELNLFNFLKTINYYRLDPSLSRQVASIIQQKSNKWLECLNQIITRQKYFKQRKTRQSSDLLKELQKTNKFMSPQEIEFLDSSLHSIKDKSKKSEIYRPQKCISNFNKTDIEQWAKNVRDICLNDNSINQCIAVIGRANNLLTGYNLKDAQIISCLLLMRTNVNQGRLLQVATGEGKSTIVSIFAIIKALQGFKINIITSSPVLAERDAKDKQKLFSLFKLSCADNNDKAVYIKGKKDCYQKDIVYGEASQFQFDTLRDVYSKLGTLAGRKNEIAIVDEVDSMLVDDSSKIVRLSSTVAGLDQLQIFYHLIWKQLKAMESKIFTVGDKTYFLYGKINNDQIPISYEYIEENKTQKIDDLNKYLSNCEDISRIGIIIEGDQTEFLQKQLINYVQKLIKSNKIKVPNNFKSYVDNQIHKWVGNALIAIMYQQQVHYLIQQGLINPVDFNNTGIIQSSTNWSDGLHQFLQIKHGLRMTSQTFTTNFQSNMGYFTKFGSNLYGLTGTIGSESVRQALKIVYKVDVINVPRSSVQQYIPLPPILAVDHVNWIGIISQSAIQQSKKNRGILIICETIQDANEISNRIKQKYNPQAVKLYTMNDMNQQKHVQNIKKREIIVATNLAGRGTDIKTDDIEQFGGLHVILAFMPSNQRVEDQAFGRTARQGKRGSGQMILNFTSLQNYSVTRNTKPSQIKQLRDKQEHNQLQKFIQTQFKTIQLKDQLFNNFCSLLDKIRQKIRKQQSLTNQKNICSKNIMNKLYYKDPSIYESSIILAIQQQWALFLRKIEDGKISVEDAHRQYIKMHNEIESSFQKNQIESSFQKNQISVIKNSNYHISIANDIIVNNSYWDKNMDIAIVQLDQAIKKDQQFCTGGYMSMAWLILKGKKRHGKENSRQKDYKTKAVKYFQKALECAQEEISQLSVALLFVQELRGSHCDLFRQLSEKQSILGSYCNSIQQNIKSIQKSSRFVNVAKQKFYQNTRKTYTIGSGDYQQELERDDYKQSIKCIKQSHSKKQKQHVKQIKMFLVEPDLSKYEYVSAKYLIQFQDLTARYDSGQIDQALDIIKFIYQDVDGNSGIRHTMQKKKNKILKFVKDKTQNVKQTVNDIAKIVTPNALTNFITAKEDSSDKNLSKKQEVRQKNQKSNKKENTNIWLYFKANAKQLKEMLSPDLYFCDLNKSQALACITNQVNFLCRHILPQKLSSSYSKTKIQIFNKIQEKIQGTKEFEYGKSKQACEYIKNKNQQNLVYNITFFNANEKFKQLNNQLFSEYQCLSLQFEQIPVNSIKKITNVIQKDLQIQQFSQSFDLQILCQKAIIVSLLSQLKQSLIEKYKQQFIDLSYDNNTKKQVLYTKQAQKYIQTMNLEGIISVRLKEIRLQLVNLIRQFTVKIAKKGIDSIFFKLKINLININCQNVKNKVFSIIGSKDVKVYFENLDYPAAKSLLPILRKQNIDFKLCASDLALNAFNKILEKSISLHKAEQIQILKEKSLSELFMSAAKPEIELTEFAARGIQYILQVSQKKYVPWRSIAVVCLLSALQMGAGIFLVGTGFGATAGMGLITEGAADLFTAYRAYSTRQFTWSDYAKQKAVSLVISVCSNGFKAIQDAAKGVKNAFNGTAKQVLKFAQMEAAQQIIVLNGKSIGQKTIGAGTKLLNLALKQTGTTIGENCVREVLTSAMDGLANFGFEQLKPKINAYIQDRVSSKFCSQILRQLVYKLIALDMLIQKNNFKNDSKHTFNKNKLKQKIDKAITNILNPQKNWLKKQWISVGGPLCKGILSSTELVGSKFSMGLRILGTLNGLQEIITIIDYVHKQLLTKLIQLHEQNCSVQALLVTQCQILGSEAKAIKQQLQKLEIVKNQQYIHQMGQMEQLSQKINIITSQKIIQKKKTNYSYEVIYFQRLQKQGKRKLKQKNMNNCTEFLSKYHKQISQRKPEDLSQIVKSISDHLTDQIIRTIQSQLISPWTSYAAGQMTKQMSKRIQHNYLVDHNQNTDELNSGQKKYKQIKQKQQKGEALTVKQKDFLENFDPYITFHSQITSNAKEYTIGYSQCQNVHFATKQSNGKDRANKQGIQYANKIRNGQPVTMGDMVSLSLKNGIKIKIVDDPNYQMTEQQKINGINVVVYKPKFDKQGKAEVGHYMRLGESQNIPESGNNNCGLDVISRILQQKGIKKSGNQLRGQLADNIQNNSHNYSKSVQPIKWLKSSYPNEAQSLICLGGKVEKPKIVDASSRCNGIELNYIYPPCQVNQDRLIDVASWIIGDYLDFIYHGVDQNNPSFPKVVLDQKSRLYLSKVQDDIQKNLKQDFFNKTGRQMTQQQSGKLQKGIKIFKNSVNNKQKFMNNFPRNDKQIPVNVSIIGHGKYGDSTISVGGKPITADDIMNQKLAQKVPANTKIICDNCCSSFFKQIKTKSEFDNLSKPENQSSLEKCVQNSFSNILANKIDKLQQNKKDADRKIKSVQGFPAPTSMYGFNGHYIEFKSKQTMSKKKGCIQQKLVYQDNQSQNK